MTNLFEDFILHWRGGNNPSNSPFLERLLNEHRKWIETKANDFKEIALGYTEWTATGQLAIAGDRLNCFVVQEYSINDKFGTGKKRPDLWLRTTPSHEGVSYVFEIKHRGISFFDDEKQVFKKLDKKLVDANTQLKSYIHEADYCCSLLLAPMWVKKEEWEEDNFQDAQAYLQGIKRLGVTLEKTLKLLKKDVANCCGGFVCDHSEASNEHDRAISELRSEFPLGAIWVGKLKHSVQNKR